MSRKFKSLLFWVTTLLFSRDIACAQAVPFERFLGKLINERDRTAKARMIDQYLWNRTLPIVEQNTVYFIYRGKGSVVELPGDFNGWDPTKARMVQIPETDLFLHIEDVKPGGRLEYKFAVDGNWMLDPNNPKKAPGGFGDNSEVWSSGYVAPQDINIVGRIPRGKLDSTIIESTFLKRKHPVFIYVPFGAPAYKRLPTIYVTDGGEYLSLGLMKNVLDNLIYQQRIKPVIAVFVDPRTDMKDNSTNQRLKDYAANDAYLDFLEGEVASFVEHNYPATRSAKDRMIMGVSMGGIISTYAVMLRSHFVKNFAAQSPAYMHAENTLMKLFEQAIKLDINAYIDCGTIKDAQEIASRVAGLLKEKGATVQYTEYPEGHNWSNWRARIDDILEYFYANK